MAEYRYRGTGPFDANDPWPTPAATHARPDVAVCGTRSGYVKHRRDKEEPCAGCKEANRQYGIEFRKGYIRPPRTSRAA